MKSVVKSVQQIIKQGKDSIDLLLEYGVNLTRKRLDQTLEGGLSQKSYLS